MFIAESSIGLRRPYTPNSEGPWRLQAKPYLAIHDFFVEG